MAEVLAAGRALRAQLRQTRGQPARRAQQEVAAAAGRVADGDGQQRGLRVGGAMGALGDHRLQRGIQQFLHQRVGRVVAAAGLAGIAFGRICIGEAEHAAVGTDVGHQFQQAFVHAAQLFRAHVAPVDAGEAAALAHPAKLGHGFEQGRIAKGAGVEVRALVFGEQATECGQRQQRLAVGQARQHRLQALPQVGVTIKGAPLAGTLAQAAQAVAIGIERDGIGIGIGRVQQAALLDGEQEDQPVDQPQQLLEIGIAIQRAAGQGIAQRLVGGFGQETLAQRQQCFFHALTELVAGAGALFLAGLAPALQRTLRCQRIRVAETAGVDQQPQQGEVGVAFFAEDAREVGFDPGRAGEAGVVARQAQQAAVAGDAPHGRVGGIEVVLQQAEGAALAATVAVAAVALVQALVGGGDDQRQAACAGAGGDGVQAFADLDRRGVRLQVSGAEHVAHERLHEPAGQTVRVFGLLARVGELAPVGLGDAPVAAHFIAQVQALGDAVVGRRLVGGLQRGDVGQPFGGQQAPFDLDGVEGQGGITAAHAPAPGISTKAAMTSTGFSASTL